MLRKFGAIRYQKICLRPLVGNLQSEGRSYQIYRFMIKNGIENYNIDHSSSLCSINDYEGYQFENHWVKYGLQQDIVVQELATAYGEGGVLLLRLPWRCAPCCCRDHIDLQNLRTLLLAWNAILIFGSKVNSYGKDRLYTFP